MPTYTATFRTDAEHAAITLEARNAKAALAKAQDLWEQNQSALIFQRYDEIQPLQEIEITNASGNPAASWVDDDLMLRGNAPEMLMALEEAVLALLSVPRFEIKQLGADSRQLASYYAALIAAATGKNI